MEIFDAYIDFQSFKDYDVACFYMPSKSVDGLIQNACNATSMTQKPMLHRVKSVRCGMSMGLTEEKALVHDLSRYNKSES